MIKIIDSWVVSRAAFSIHSARLGMLPSFGIAGTCSLKLLGLLGALYPGSKKPDALGRVCGVGSFSNRRPVLNKFLQRHFNNRNNSGCHGGQVPFFGLAAWLILPEEQGRSSGVGASNGCAAHPFELTGPWCIRCVASPLGSLGMSKKSDTPRSTSWEVFLGAERHFGLWEVTWEVGGSSLKSRKSPDGRFQLGKHGETNQLLVFFRQPDWPYRTYHFAG